MVEVAYLAKPFTHIYTYTYTLGCMCAHPAGPVDDYVVDDAVLARAQKPAATLRGENETDELFRGDWQVVKGR